MHFLISLTISDKSTFPTEFFISFKSSEFLIKFSSIDEKSTLFKTSSKFLIFWQFSFNILVSSVLSKFSTDEIKD